MNVKKIVAEWLAESGYDGLVEMDGECACSVDDLMPCSEPGVWCEAGHVMKCDCGEGCDYHIVPGKRPTGAEEA